MDLIGASVEQDKSARMVVWSCSLLSDAFL